MSEETRQKDYKDRLTQENRCHCCKRAKIADGKKCCSSCINRASERNKVELAGSNQPYWKYRVQQKLSLGLCVRCGKENNSNKKNCAGCLKKQSLRSLEIKKKVIEHYGSVCVCCSENNIGFLTLDHINNDGAEERKNIFGKNKSGIGFYTHVIKAGFPDNLQVLCYNCNCGRFHNNNICPHKIV